MTFSIAARCRTSGRFGIVVTIITYASLIVGELVPDTIQLRIPPNARPGQYRLLAGLRDPDAPTRGSSGLVTIGTLDVR